MHVHVSLCMHVCVPVCICYTALYYLMGNRHSSVWRKQPDKKESWLERSRGADFCLHTHWQITKLACNFMHLLQVCPDWIISQSQELYLKWDFSRSSLVGLMSNQDVPQKPLFHQRTKLNISFKSSPGRGRADESDCVEKSVNPFSCWFWSPDCLLRDENEFVPSMNIFLLHILLRNKPKLNTELFIDLQNLHAGLQRWGTCYFHRGTRFGCHCSQAIHNSLQL